MNYRPLKVVALTENGVVVSETQCDCDEVAKVVRDACRFLPGVKRIPVLDEAGNYVTL